MRCARDDAMYGEFIASCVLCVQEKKLESLVSTLLGIAGSQWDVCVCVCMFVYILKFH